MRVKGFFGVGDRVLHWFNGKSPREPFPPNPPNDEIPNARSNPARTASPSPRPAPLASHRHRRTPQAARPDSSLSEDITPTETTRRHSRSRSEFHPPRRRRSGQRRDVDSSGWHHTDNAVAHRHDNDHLAFRRFDKGCLPDHLPDHDRRRQNRGLQFRDFVL